jgi:hypothetical protein
MQLHTETESLLIERDTGLRWHLQHGAAGPYYINYRHGLRRFPSEFYSQTGALLSDYVAA